MIGNNSKQEFIDKKRREIILELKDYLKEANHSMVVGQILNAVFDDDREDAFDDLVIKLAESDGVPDPESAQEFAMELFNYFPRKSFGGKSLTEKMPFDELKKMEKAFQDFKDGTTSSDYSYTLPKE